MPYRIDASRCAVGVCSLRLQRSAPASAARAPATAAHRAWQRTLRSARLLGPSGSGVGTEELGLGARGPQLR
eukprot:14981345-Alexandrium_andersonii.AAC.1